MKMGRPDGRIFPAKGLNGAGRHTAGQRRFLQSDNKLSNKLNEASAMSQPIHQRAMEIAEQAIVIMDDFMRNRIDIDTYAQKLNTLDVDSIMEQLHQEFKKDHKSVYSLEILMILSSLQHELEFQVKEYGANVVSEDIKMLKEMLYKLTQPDS
jgi:hypothetical protein